ncbi:phosphohistidine phosphatase SixA [Gallaecimonas sp. GXIMD4217]|uniref:phosphohistidine phosphatase SixA n=1 Tax=Gallaecimonas sp. GXIMD4217 TaxID=3131927 RepID=UPI00311B2459
MQVLIMRHGQAVPQAPSDAERSLTARGEEEAWAQGNWLKSQGLVPSRLFVSPYRRTRQTAAQVGAAFANVEPVTLDELTPSGNLQAVTDLIHGYLGSDETLLLVSHMPLVAYLVEALVPGQAPLAFATGQIIWLQEEQGRLRIQAQRLPSLG